MLTTSHPSRAGGKLPTELRQWLGERDLVSLTLEAVQAVNQRFPHVSDDAPKHRQKMMLTLLSYCYAAGICGSQDIEWAVHSDPTVRYICAGDEPDWLAIRRFRRQTMELLRQSLAHIYKAALERRTGCEPAANSPIGCIESSSDQEISRAVDHRIAMAIRMDAAASDF